MKHSEGKFSGYKNLNLYYQCWEPTGKPNAVLLFVHGLAEHCGRYAGIAQRFAGRDYAVFIFDYQGHGKSEGRRGYVEHFSCYLDDLKAFLDVVRSKYREEKIFLIGHSMGALLAATYSIHHQEELAGLILSGTSLKINTGLPSALTAAAQLISQLMPKMGVSVLDASALSRDSAVVDAYVNDPLVYRGKISARLGTELLRTAQRLSQQMPDIKLPVLIMHGAADRLCYPEGSKILYQRIGSKDKTLKLYDGFYHEIFNEPGREQVIADMETWLAAHV